MINIRTKYNDYKPADDQYKDTLVLGHSSWNDYGYRTLYYAYYCDRFGKAHKIGAVKIYHKGLDWEEHITIDDMNVDKFIRNGSIINYLSDSFCSLGESLEYYSNLKLYFPSEYSEILKRLRDMAADGKIRDEFQNYEGVKTSLLRDSSAEKALLEAEELFEGLSINHNMSFVYKYTAPYSELSTEIKFDFKEKNKYFPYRINTIVGKNGTGKTHLLSSLARAISGNTKNAKDFEDAFVGKRPPFYKVMSISYSAFDSFSKFENNKFCNYVYCGIQKEMDDEPKDDEQNNNEHSKINIQTVVLTKAEMKAKCITVLKEIHLHNRIDDWDEIMSELIGEDELIELRNQLNSNAPELHLSSGQNMLIMSMTMVVAYIEKESILLIDEPELHLHPNAVASLMRMLNKLLVKYNSYAIIATHSPLVLQELPSYSIIVLDRLENILTTRKPNIECFGAGISNIIDETFDVRNNESSYKTIFLEASKNLTEKEIIAFFEDDLSINAMVYLKTIYEGKS